MILGRWHSKVYLHLRSLTDRTEALQPSKIPLHASPSRWLITLISKFNGLSNMRVYLSQALRRWEPKVLFLKCGSWRIACNSTPSPPARGYWRGKEWGTGVVLIGVCSDDIFPTSEWQRNFIQVCPSRILGYIDTTPGGNNLCWVKYRHAG